MDSILVLATALLFVPLVTERIYESTFSEGREELVANSGGIR